MGNHITGQYSRTLPIWTLWSSDIVKYTDVEHPHREIQLYLLLAEALITT